MAMDAPRYEDRCRLIARHVRTEFARDRLIKALYDAVYDGLEFGPRDLPLAEDREWIRGAIAVPLQDAADAALDVLAASIAQSLERSPTGWLDRFEHSHHLVELGLD
jgi:hypothetical protein